MGHNPCLQTGAPFAWGRGAGGEDPALEFRSGLVYLGRSDGSRHCAVKGRSGSTKENPKARSEPRLVPHKGL